MEMGDATVSIDLLVRSLLSIGASRKDIARVIGRTQRTLRATDGSVGSFELGSTPDADVCFQPCGLDKPRDTIDRDLSADAGQREMRMRLPRTVTRAPASTSLAKRARTSARRTIRAAAGTSGRRITPVWVHPPGTRAFRSRCRWSRELVPPPLPDPGRHGRRDPYRRETGFRHSRAPVRVAIPPGADPRSDRRGSHSYARAGRTVSSESRAMMEWAYARQARMSSGSRPGWSVRIASSDSPWARRFRSTRPRFAFRGRWVCPQRFRD